MGFFCYSIIMEIKEITNRDIWENFLLTKKEKTFLNSWNWGEFQKKQEDKVWRLGIYNNELVSLALVIKIKARRGTFFFLPHCLINKEEHLKVLLDYLKKLAKKEKASFIRIAPLLERNETNNNLFKGFKKAPIHMHPELTWELDISKNEEKILSEMRKNTRYLIRRADKNKDIEIVKSSDINDLKKFNQVYKETARRHSFVPFSLDYLEKQFSCFSDDIVIFLGKYKEEVISSAVMIYWQGTGYYHHGASLSKYNSNKIPISYLLQWEAIKEGKARDCLKYNFWGIAPTNNKNHPWAGLTLFKRGFGGYRKDYVETKDLPLSLTYYLTYLFEKIRKVKRRL